MFITEIRETKDISDILKKRGLLEQYEKSKKYILSGNRGKTNLKILHPKHLQRSSFRINKQFRAIGFRSGTVLKIFKIDNHQNF